LEATDSDPAVSVVMPVRDGMPFVREAIASILGQSLHDFELLVVNDGSTDGTREWIASLDDPRVRLIDAEGRGVVAALNTGVAHARGEFLARHDADDLSHPERLAVQLAFLRDHPEVDIVGSLSHFIDDRGRPVDTPWVADVRRVHDAACTPEALRTLLPLTCGIAHGTVFMRTSVVREAGGYRPEFEWAEDYDLWLRLLPRHRFAKIPRPLYWHRLHDRQVGAQYRDTQLRRTIAAKLDYIQRRWPEIGAGSTITIQGNGPAAAVYIALARDRGLRQVDANARILVVTDVAQLEHWRATRPGSAWEWEGNIALAST
jgi:glycosyltransferase involved in cell wall biosynthesis